MVIPVICNCKIINIVSVTTCREFEYYSSMCQYIVKSCSQQNFFNEIKIRYSCSSRIGRRWSYGCCLAVRSHQCQVLKIKVSIPLHVLAIFIESSFKTRPLLSLTRSTRNAFLSSIRDRSKPWKIVHNNYNI